MTATAHPTYGTGHQPDVPLLDVSGLRVSYGGVLAVNDIHFAIAPGTVTGLIGPNGAGKTTVIDALTGYKRPFAGRIAFGGEDITGLRAHERSRRGLARTFQSVELFDDLTVEENVLVAAESPGVVTALRQLFWSGRPESRETVEWALEVTGLADAGHRLPQELSFGQRKLAGVARALARRPKLVLLDEPAAGLDTRETVDFGQHLLRALPEHGVSVLLVDHDMGLVLSVCDQVLVLDFGRVIARGTPRQIRDDPTVKQAYLGTHQEGK
jgi:branched-chain amino acid transport system ATP-binding protein